MNFTSIYKKDFVARPIKVQPSYRNKTIQNPIADSFIEYLKLDTDKETLHDPEEHLSDYLENSFKVEHPHLAERYFSEDINDDIINDYRRDCKQTTYRGHYCDPNLLSKTSQKYDFNLDVHNIPETTHKKSYRDPSVIKDSALQRRPQIVPMMSIGERRDSDKLIGIQTGISTYTDEYGKLGAEIIEHQLLGKIVHPKCDCSAHNL